MRNCAALPNPIVADSEPTPVWSATLPLGLLQVCPLLGRIERILEGRRGGLVFYSNPSTTYKFPSTRSVLYA